MNKKPVLNYYDMSEAVTAFSTTRHGGCSEGNYASLNINPYCGDDSSAVASNRQLLAEELSLRADHILLPHQIHQTEVRLIGEDFFSLPESIRQMILEGVDGVMTSMPGVCVGVSTADCVPVLIHDTQHHAVAAIHAGWRGTVARIVQKALMQLNAAFGSQPKDLQVVIGPSISVEAFEVGQEVYEQFQNAAFPLDRIAEFHGKWHIDLPLCNQLQLEGVGVPATQIRQCGICTYGQVSDYFSARRLGTESGRIYTGIFLK